ncbi:MAG: transglycosylase SLT domain-containing protein [Bacteroidota bacterium]
MLRSWTYRYQHWLVVACFLPHLLSAMEWTAEKEQQIVQQIYCLPVHIDVNYDQHVKKYVRSYLTTGRLETTKMLRRADYFFPVFEHYLRLHELPEELKYLPVVESRLIADAQSTAGASGLWQFIKPTARAYGLRVNSYVDERLDVYKSTEAAIELFKALYEEFGDWTLVLAAYNCGPSRVHRAVRRAKSTDFDLVAPYLPKQTRKYIPKYIATIFAMEHFSEHVTIKSVPTASLAHYETQTIQVFDRLSFRRIAAVCKLPEATIERLNPGFLRSVIPGSRSGYHLQLPAKVMPTLRAYIAHQRASTWPLLRQQAYQSRYIVGAGDTVAVLAARFRCTEQEIIEWNQLGNRDLLVRESLVLQAPKAPIRFSP